MNIKMIVTDTAPVKSELLAFSELMELTGLHPSVLGELIEMGWISPVRTMSQAMLFSARDVYRTRKLARIARDLEITLSGASIIVDLLERVEYLEHKVRELHRLL